MTGLTNHYKLCRAQSINNHKTWTGNNGGGGHFIFLNMFHYRNPVEFLAKITAEMCLMRVLTKIQNRNLQLGG